MVTGTGKETLDFTIEGSFVPQFNIQCEGSSGSVALPPSPRGQLTFTLPAEDGAKHELPKYWTFTLVEQSE